MKVSDILRDIMKSKEITQVALGKRIGIKNDTLYQRLRHPNISINALVPMLQAMDYKIIIVPADRRVKDGEYEVSASDQAPVKPRVDLDELLGSAPESKAGKIKLVDTPRPGKGADEA